MLQITNFLGSPLDTNIKELNNNSSPVKQKNYTHRRMMLQLSALHHIDGYYTGADRSKLWIGFPLGHVFLRIRQKHDHSYHANSDGLRQKFYQMLLSDIFPRANDLQNAFTSAYNGKDIRALGKPHFDYRQNCKEDGFIPQPEGINFLLDKVINSMLKAPWMYLYDRLHSQTPIGSNPIESTCSHAQVILFVKNVISALIPDELWGGMHNKTVIMETIEQFIGLSDGTKLLFHEIMEKIKTHLWLKSILECDPAQKRQLHSEFIWWILDQLFCSLLRTNFYIMSAGKFGTGSIFFRQGILKEAPWVGIAEKYELCLVNPEETTLYTEAKLGIKSTGFCPVALLNRQQHYVGTSVNKEPVNSILKPIQSILSLENDMVNDNGLYHELQGALEKYVITHRWQDNAKPLWFAKTDISSCFESIKQDKLLQVLKEQTLQHKEYNVCSLAAVHHAGDKFFTTSKMIASPSGNCVACYYRDKFWY